MDGWRVWEVIVDHHQIPLIKSILYVSNNMWDPTLAPQPHQWTPNNLPEVVNMLYSASNQPHYGSAFGLPVKARNLWWQPISSLSAIPTYHYKKIIASICALISWKACVERLSVRYSTANPKNLLSWDNRQWNIDTWGAELVTGLGWRPVTSSAPQCPCPICYPKTTLH